MTRSTHEPSRQRRGGQQSQPVRNGGAQKEDRFSSAKYAWAKAKRVKTQKQRRLDQRRAKLLNELGIDSAKEPQRKQEHRPRSIFEKEEIEGEARRKEREAERNAKEEKYQRDRERREEQMEKRKQRSRQYRKKNAKGQPLMRYRIEAMLEKLEKEKANEHKDGKESKSGD